MNGEEEGEWRELLGRAHNVVKVSLSHHTIGHSSSAVHDFSDAWGIERGLGGGGMLTVLLQDFRRSPSHPNRQSIHNIINRSDRTTGGNAIARGSSC